MNWRQFEFLVADLFRREGWLVHEGPGQGDGGVDLVLLTAQGEKYCVQCKQYRSWSVGAPRVREFLGALVAHGSGGPRGFIVTCGNFTSEARQLARANGIALIDGDSLLRRVRLVNGSPAFAEDREIGCPKCGSAMVLRTAKRGNYIGEQFWGCTMFPQCRGIRKYRPTPPQ